MTYTSISTAILAITAWNLAAWAPECYLLLCARRFSAVLRSVAQTVYEPCSSSAVCATVMEHVAREGILLVMSSTYIYDPSHELLTFISQLRSA